MEDEAQPAIQQRKRAVDVEHSRNYRMRKKAREEKACRELRERTYCKCIQVNCVIHSLLLFSAAF